MRLQKILPALFVAALAVVEASETPSKRASEEAQELFDQYAANGLKRYNRIQAALADSTTTDVTFAPCNFEPGNNWWTKGTNAEPAAPKGRLLQMINAAGLPISTTAANFYDITIGSPWNGKKNDIPTPGEDGQCFYDNAYNPVDNVIAVVDIWKSRTPSTLPSWTDPSWTMWTLVKDRAGSSTYGDLNALVHYSCSNDGAKAVAEVIFLNANDEWDSQVITFEPGSDAFNALLGIDNGVSATNILINHKNALGGKNLKSITAWGDGGPLMGVSYNFG